MALEDELEKLKSLPPAERIRKLREIEERRKKEIREAEKLIKESEEEAEDQEILDRELPAPQMKAASADVLDSIDAKLLWANKRGVSLTSEREEVALPSERREISEVAEEDTGKTRGLNVAHYGEIVEKVNRESTPAISDAYKATQQFRKSEEEYEMITEKKNPSVTYQKPYVQTEFTSEGRKATPGQESETSDFYKVEKKKRT